MTKLMVVAAAAMCGTATFAAPQPRCAAAQGWNFDAAVSDEFEGGVLDRGKWQDWCATFPGRRSPGENGSPLVSGFEFDPGNVRVDSGELVLESRRMRPDESTRQLWYTRRGPYRTAIVKAAAKTHYGYYEIEAKTGASCASSAFWLYDPLSDDPGRKFAAGDTSEEIDIFELVGRPDAANVSNDWSKTYCMNCHVMLTPYLEGTVYGGRKELPSQQCKHEPLGFNPSDGYHVYGLLWTAEEMVWYVDGKEFFRRPNDHFKRPLHVTFDSEIFPTWFGMPDDRDFPSRFRIRYFRYWKQP